MNDLSFALRRGPVAELCDRHNLTPAMLQEIIGAVRHERLGPDAFEHIPGVITGSYRDIIYRPNQEPAIGEWSENLVVDSFALLLTALCLTGRTPTYSGITHMALGQGSSTWDTDGTPTPQTSDTTLTSELARKPLDSLSDINGSNTVVGTGPTGRLLASCTFLPGEAIGSIREFGLFGGIAGAGHSLDDANQGIMVNHITHGVLVKSLISDFSFVRQLRLIF